MKSVASFYRRRTASSDGGNIRFRMRQLPFMGVICTVTLFILYRTTNYQYYEAGLETKLHSFDTIEEYESHTEQTKGLPRGIVQPRSDLELKPQWSRRKVHVPTNKNLLAMPAGIQQKENVDVVVQKFLAAKFTIVLFHYDGKVDGWWDLDWCDKAIHIVANNQTKWWFAKRFLHPDIVSIYDYIFLWDEDLGVENFNPARYLRIAREEGLEISQPALDPNSTEIHHRITIRARTKKFHRRVYEDRGKTRCSGASEGPPCSGFVEGMAPVFSRAAWYCAWHLIQNDLVHGWGMDMKLGYCAQGDRSKNVGVIDSEYIVHKGIQTLGGGTGPPTAKSKKRPPLSRASGYYLSGRRGPRTPKSKKSPPLSRASGYYLSGRKRLPTPKFKKSPPSSRASGYYLSGRRGPPTPKSKKGPPLSRASVYYMSGRTRLPTPKFKKSPPSSRASGYYLSGRTGPPTPISKEGPPLSRASGYYLSGRKRLPTPKLKKSPPSSRASGYYLSGRTGPPTPISKKGPPLSRASGYHLSGRTRLPMPKLRKSSPLSRAKGYYLSGRTGLTTPISKKSPPLSRASGYYLNSGKVLSTPKSRKIPPSRRAFGYYLSGGKWPPPPKFKKSPPSSRAAGYYLSGRTGPPTPKYRKSPPSSRASGYYMSGRTGSSTPKYKKSALSSRVSGYYLSGRKGPLTPKSKKSSPPSKASLYDPRAEIRRQSTWELKTFKERWNKAVQQDKHWNDPFPIRPLWLRTLIPERKLS